MTKISNQFAFNRFGDVDVFEEIEVPLTLTSNRDVLVRVERVGINPVDTMMRSGKMSSLKEPGGYVVLGSELQGEVLDLLNPVEGLNIGDKVIVKMTSGAYANHITVNHAHVYRVPEGMDLDFAAGFSSTAITAYWAVNGPFYTIKPNDTVAVIGASGAVGSFAVQLLKDKGVKILAVASKKNEDYLKSLGADVFIDYNDPNSYEEHINTVDYIIDASLFNSGENLALKIIKDGGTYLAMTTMPQGTNGKKISLKFLSRDASMTANIALNDLFKFYQDHGLTLQIAYKLPLSLEGVKEAHRLIVGKRTSGKIILSKDI